MPAAQEGSQAGWRRTVWRHPLFVAAMLSVACVVASSHLPFAGFAVAVAAGLAGTWQFGWKPGVSFLMCGLLSVSWFLWRDARRAHQERELAALEGVVPVKVGAVLLADAKGGGHRW